MVTLDEFERYVKKLSPFTLDLCIPEGEVYRDTKIGLFGPFINFFYENENANQLKKSNFTNYIQQAAKSFFALGLYECLQRIPVSWTEKEYHNCIRYLIKRGVWIEAFEDQDIDEEYEINAKILAYQDGFIMSFNSELRDNEYLSIYLRQYYYIGWNFGRKLIIGI